MDCYACGAILDKGDHCPVCGADVTLYKRLICASNLCYNEGLIRAGVRDLSGAAEVLRHSLRLYKMNIPARNLLGLVYFEMGEVVDALSEWVISKNLSPENNPAEHYLTVIQSDEKHLELVNQTIKKYNQALMYCRQGSRDLALIQLKKVLAINPKLVKAHQLLALLYIEDGKYDLAKRALRHAGRIDANNTTTLRYLYEVNAQLKKETLVGKTARREKEKEELISYQSGNDTIIHPATFKDNTALMAVINVAVGLVVGVLITGFLVVPGVRQSALSNSSKSLREASETISTKNENIKSLENQIAELNSQIESLNTDKEGNVTVVSSYEQVLVAYKAYQEQDYEKAGEAIVSIDASLLSGTTSEIYEQLKDPILDQYKQLLYRDGVTAAASADYETAAAKFTSLIGIDEEYGEGDALYQLAEAYRNAENTEQAAAYYQKVIEKKPDSALAATAQARLDEMNQGTQSPDEQSQGEQNQGEQSQAEQSQGEE